MQWRRQVTKWSVLRLWHVIRTCIKLAPLTKNKIRDSPDYQLNKNSVNNSSFPSPSHSDHGSPWKLGFMQTEWAREVTGRLYHHSPIMLGLGVNTCLKHRFPRKNNLNKVFFYLVNQMTFLFVIKRCGLMDLHCSTQEYRKCNDEIRHFRYHIQWIKLQANGSQMESIRPICSTGNIEIEKKNVLKL